MRPQLDRDIWNRIASVFDRAVDVNAAERPALLDQLCGSDITVRREVEEMIEAHERDVGLIVERRVATADAEASRLDGLLGPGTRVGIHRVVEMIGAGGMGDVYRAERTDDAYRQTVAVKVLRLGLRAGELARRFRIEREALARLVHPGIVPILDAGTLEDGRPYIVLQFVDGVPITRHCEAHSLSVRERLRLFVEVANIVQYAHGRLVVHRDIKPSNILVPADGKPRLLDFGIAKLLGSDEGASLLAPTASELRLFTPEYASPEQLRGESPTTATDVYALGALLFEMLTGAKPFSSAGRSAAALEDAILHTPAPAPSSVAPARGWRGDLDRIVLMALRKEPERRYLSAAQLGEDVERYLADEPVRARPDTLRYRAARFVARNRALVASTAAASVLVLGFGVTATLQARHVSRERDRAERERVAAEDVLGILTGLFEQADPNKHPGGDTVRVSSLLDSAEQRVSRMHDDRSRQAALWRAVGRMRAARGEYARALELLTAAYEQRRAIYGAEDLEAARIHHEMGQTLVSVRGEAEARPTLDSSLTELRRVLGDRGEEIRAATSDLLAATFDSVAARALMARLEHLEGTPAFDPVAIADRLNERGTALERQGHHGEAAALFRASLQALQGHLSPDHDDVRTVRRNLAVALVGQGRLADAESLQRNELAVEQRIHRSPVTRAMAEEALALTLAAEQRPESAEVHEREALRYFREGAAPEHWRVWSAHRNLAFIVAAGGRPAESIDHLDSAIATARLGADTAENVGYLIAQRIPFLLRLHRLDEASRSLARAENMLGASPAVTRAHRADVHRYAGMLLFASGDAVRAAERFRAAVALVESPGVPERRQGIHSCLLGVALAATGRREEARPLLDAPCARYQAQGLADPLIKSWIAAARARFE